MDNAAKAAATNLAKGHVLRIGKNIKEKMCWKNQPGNPRGVAQSCL
jgi:hypothetical protein